MIDKKGKKATPDDIMSAAEMKPILAMARHGNPASCVIALTKDKEGVVLLHRRRAPKQLLAQLKKQAAGIGLELEVPTLRFGRAVVDQHESASLLTFTVNRDAPGSMRPKLLEQVRKAGFSRVEIIADAGLESEPDEDEEEAEGAAAAAGPAETPFASAAPSAPAAPSEPPAAPAAQAEAPPPAGPQGQGPDTAVMTKILTDLVRRMIPVIAADRGRAGTLKELALRAQAQIKTGDVSGAGAAIEALRREVDAPRPAATAAPAAAGSASTAAFAKARVAWLAARRKVETEVGKLHAEMTSAYQGHGFGADLDRFFRAKVEPMMGSLDESLAHKLQEVTSNTDQAQHAQLVREAKQIIQRYETYVAGEKLIGKLDNNPFVPLAIEKTLTATLTTLGKVIA